MTTDRTRADEVPDDDEPDHPIPAGWKLTPMCIAYGNGFDPLDLDREYVSARGEVRWLEDSFNGVFRWRPADRPDDPLTESTRDEWLEWTGPSVLGVERDA